MKKGEKAKLDAKWWKKNKSMRLKSKTFDTCLEGYVGACAAAEISPTADTVSKAIDLAKTVRKEAGALAGKCGKFQDETKAVLLDYTTLFSAELSKLSKLESQVKSAMAGAEKAFAALEARIKTQQGNISLISKAAAQAANVAEASIKSAPDKFIGLCEDRVKKIEAIVKELGSIDKDADAVMSMKGGTDVRNANARVAKIKKAALGLMQLVRQTEAHWTALIEQAKAGAKTGAAAT